MTNDGVLVIKAQTYRTQEKNRQEALARLRTCSQRAAVAPTVRRPTRPTRASNQRRLEAKRITGAVKALRRVEAEE